VKTIKAFLVFRASDQSLRVVRRVQPLKWDEIQFSLTVNVPDPWGKLAGAVVIDLPEGGPAVVEVQVTPDASSSVTVLCSCGARTEPHPKGETPCMYTKGLTDE
jgi:hypothetical protein